MTDLNELFKVIAEGKKQYEETDPTGQKIKRAKEHVKEDLSVLFSQLVSLKEDLEKELVVAESKQEQAPMITEEIPAQPIIHTPEVRAAQVDADVNKYLTDKSFQNPQPDIVNKDVEAIRNKIRFLEQAIGKIAAAGPGGGEVNLRWLDDVDRSTITDGWYLRYSESKKKFEFAEVQASGGNGATGPAGATGPQGDTGGASGPQGDIGATGPQGVDGASGVNGLDGATGPQGIDGASGATGIDGSTGPQGASGIDGINGATGIDGASGVQGEPGATGITGASGVDGATGFGIDGSTGPQGEFGATGIDGASGATGTQGASGIDGTNGVDGATGLTGSTGPQGASGATGINGASGVNGASGLQGASGIQGASGATGTQGASGVGATGLTGASGPAGAGGAVAYYGSFYDSQTRIATAERVGYPIPLDHLGEANGVSVQNNSQVKVANAGVYNIQFSCELHNSGGGGAGTTVTIWLVKNGIALADTATKINVNTNSPYVVPAWNFVLTLAANDYVELYWSTDNINIIIEATGATGAQGATGFSPAIPSTILTIQQIAYGISGASGVQGASGSTGLTGATGTQGVSGATGPGAPLAAGYVNAGSFVTLDNIKATVPTSGNRGLSLATVSGSFTALYSGFYGLAGGGNGNAGTSTITTTPSVSLFGWHFPGAGDGSTYLINDTTNSRFYRINLSIGSGYNNNAISIERLI